MDDEIFSFPEHKARYLKGAVNALMGIELLEYENKDFLSGTNKTRSEVKQGILKECMRILEVVLT